MPTPDLADEKGALRAYVDALELPDAPPMLESAAAEVPGFSTQPEAVAVGTQLAEFSARVTPAQRAVVADCLLLAQLAADKAASAQGDVQAWYQRYAEVLRTLGWNQRALSFEKRAIGHQLLDMNQAVLPVLTQMLGPAVAASSLVLSVLKGLQEMDRDQPWITLFDRASQHASGAKFQLGYVDAPADAQGDSAGSVGVQLLALAVQAQRSITQVLFFRFSDQQATLHSAEGQLEMTAERLAQVGPLVAAKVAPYLADSIGSIDI